MEWVLLGMNNNHSSRVEFARSTQNYIDEQNERIRQHDKWRNKS